MIGLASRRGCRKRMDGILSMLLNIGVTTKFMDLMALHIPTLNTTTKITGGIERKMGKGYPVIVTHWMPLPNSPKKEQK